MHKQVLLSSISLSSDNGMSINLSKNIISSTGNITIVHSNDGIKYSITGKRIFAIFNDRSINSNFNQTINNIKHIEMKNDIVIMLHDTKISGNQYIYDGISMIHQVTPSKGKKIVISSAKYVIYGENLLQYDAQEQNITISGKTQMIYKKKTNVIANAIVMQLKDMNPYRVELFDNIKFVNLNNEITASYANYSFKTYELHLYDDIVIKNKNSVTHACEMIINLNTNKYKIISCQKE